MASVRKRILPSGKISWQVDYKDQDGARRSIQFARKKDADTHRQTIEREQHDEVHIARSVAIPFSALAKRFLRECERRHKIKDLMSGNTLALTRGLVEGHLIVHFGDRLVTEITADQIRAFVNLKAADYAHVTIVKLVVALRQIMQLGLEIGALKRNIVRDQPPRIPVARQQQIDIPSLDELRHLLAVLADPPREMVIRRDTTWPIRRVVVLLALTAGMRKGEICALQWANVDFDAQLIRVRHSLSRYDGLKEPKTRAGVRDVPLVPQAAAALKALRDILQAAEGYVITSRNGKPVGARDLSTTYWEPLAREAKMFRKDGSIFGMHSLRHAAASLWIRGGLPVLAVKKSIGHSSITTTMDVYGHEFREDEMTRRVAVEAASDLLIAQTPRDITPPLNATY